MAAATEPGTTAQRKQSTKQRTTAGAVKPVRTLRRKSSAKPTGSGKTVNGQATDTNRSQPQPAGMPCDGKLNGFVADCMAKYFSTLNGHQPNNLYDMVIGEIEAPLLSAALEYCEGNQSRAAEMLGLNRGTLRKKLRTYNISA